MGKKYSTKIGFFLFFIYLFIYLFIFCLMSFQDLNRNAPKVFLNKYRIFFVIVMHYHFL